MVVPELVRKHRDDRQRSRGVHVRRDQASEVAPAALVRFARRLEQALRQAQVPGRGAWKGWWHGLVGQRPHRQPLPTSAMESNRNLLVAYTSLVNATSITIMCSNDVQMNHYQPMVFMGCQPDLHVPSQRMAP